MKYAGVMPARIAERRPKSVKVQKTVHQKRLECLPICCGYLNGCCAPNISHKGMFQTLNLTSQCPLTERDGLRLTIRHLFIFPSLTASLYTAGLLPGVPQRTGGLRAVGPCQQGIFVWPPPLPAQLLLMDDAISCQELVRHRMHLLLFHLPYLCRKIQTGCDSSYML